MKRYLSQVLVTLVTMIALVGNSVAGDSITCDMSNAATSTQANADVSEMHDGHMHQGMDHSMHMSESSQDNGKTVVMFHSKMQMSNMVHGNMDCCDTDCKCIDGTSHTTAFINFPPMADEFVSTAGENHSYDNQFTEVIPASLYRPPII